MDHIDTARVADTILAAPGWARLGIAAPAPHLREDAARELARMILVAIAGSGSVRSDGERPGLPL